MSVSVVYDSRAERDLWKLPPEIAERLHAAVLRLAEDPLAGKALHGKLAGFRSVRVGDYRAVYAFYPSQRRVTVHRIAHRREIYRG